MFFIPSALELDVSLLSTAWLPAGESQRAQESQPVCSCSKSGAAVPGEALLPDSPGVAGQEQPGQL